MSSVLQGFLMTHPGTKFSDDFILIKDFLLIKHQMHIDSNREISKFITPISSLMTDHIKYPALKLYTESILNHLDEHCIEKILENVYKSIKVYIFVDCTIYISQRKIIQSLWSQIKNYKTDMCSILLV